VRYGVGILALAGLAAMAPAPRAAAAQSSPLVLEARVGGSSAVGRFRTGDRVGEGARAGASFAVTFIHTGSGRRSLYFGFSQERFDCAQAGCPAARSFVATGLNGGFRLTLCSRCSVAPWIRLGGLTTRLESPGVPGSPMGVSRLAFGGEAGVGVYLGAWRSVALDPGIRLAAVDTRLPGGSLLRMRYAVLDLGLVLAF
jgi:hypothetical protein